MSPYFNPIRGDTDSLYGEGGLFYGMNAYSSLMFHLSIRYQKQVLRSPVAFSGFPKPASRTVSYC